MLPPSATPRVSEWPEAKADVFDYIEPFQNPKRRHSTIGYLSPIEFERQAGLAQAGVNRTRCSSFSFAYLTETITHLVDRHSNESRLLAVCIEGAIHADYPFDALFGVDNFALNAEIVDLGLENERISARS